MDDLHSYVLVQVNGYIHVIPHFLSCQPQAWCHNRDLVFLSMCMSVNISDHLCIDPAVQVCLGVT